MAAFREPWYVTRESVMRAPDIKASAYNSTDIDSACASASREVGKLLHRTFYPYTGTYSFDWPNSQDASVERLWLDDRQLISLTTATSGTVTIPVNKILLYPDSGPPYSRIEIDRSSSYAFSYGSGVGQNSIVLTGVWGYNALESNTTSALVGAINSSVTSLTISSYAEVGQLLRVDSERMIVTEKDWITSVQTGTLAASNAAVTLAVANGAVFSRGEELLLDAERVRVEDISGNTLIVRRAVSGSVLAAHTAATIYWPRSLTVVRGAVGTTAASHLDAASVFRQTYPAPVVELARAYALDTFFQAGTGYARTVGSGESERQSSGRAIRDLEERVYGGYGRRIRMRVV